ncbi:hypothetical protein [Devosia sp.]|uniref:hypothetical protein n=1 Tax=Devosia sp. TaxID=1871048 RepID=UPI0026334C80|nr:hypothetical protein [Devosia sp.]
MARLALSIAARSIAILVAPSQRCDKYETDPPATHYPQAREFCKIGLARAIADH